LLNYSSVGRQSTLIEMGCGVGNSIFPILEHNQEMVVYGLDFSSEAIDLLRLHPLYKTTKRCKGFVCDLTAVVH